MKLIDNFEGEYDYVTNEGTVFTFKTNRHSPNYRLINIDFTDPEESKWKVLVPEHKKDVLGKTACCLRAVLPCWVSTSAERSASRPLVAHYKVKNLQPLSSGHEVSKQCHQVCTAGCLCGDYNIMQGHPNHCEDMNPDFLGGAF